MAVYHRVVALGVGGGVVGTEGVVFFRTISGVGSEDLDDHVLATLGLMGSKSFLKKAAAVKDATNMRGLWTAVSLYAADNSNKLPGPINSGQKALYGLACTGRISFFLAPYLGYENPKANEFLDAMASCWQKTPATMATPCYLIRSDVPPKPGSRSGHLPA